MPPVRIVPALDELEHRHLSLGLIPEPPSIQGRAFQGGEEGFAWRAVKGISHRPHGRPDRGLVTEESEPNGRIRLPLPWSDRWITASGGRCHNATLRA